MTEKGHWYTDKNGNHYFVEDGQSPKEGWEQSKRRKMIDGGKYKVDDGDGKGPREVSMEEYNKYEADDDFDINVDDDFGFDEEDNVTEDTGIDEQKLNHVKEYFDIWGKPLESEWSDVVKHYDLNEKEAAELKKYFQADNSGEIENEGNADPAKKQDDRRRFLKEKGLDSKYELDKNGYLIDKADGMAVLNFEELNDDFDEVIHQIDYYERMEGDNRNGTKAGDREISKSNPDDPKYEGPKNAPAGPGEPPDEKYVRYPNNWINRNDEWYENEDQLVKHAGEGARSQIRDATDDEISKSKEYRYRELRTMADSKTKMKDFIKSLTGYDIDDEELFILYDFLKRVK